MTATVSFQADLEARTQKIGRELLERLRAARPWVLQREWLQEKMLRQFMADEHFKVQAFRFVDALPALTSSKAVASHLREYFAAPHAGPSTNGAAGQRGSRLANLARVWMNWRRDGGIRASFTSWLARRAAFGMSGSFIAGSNIAEAEAAIRAMRRQKLAFTIDLLGETALSQKEADQYHRLYLQLLDELPRRAATWPAVPQIDGNEHGPPRVNVSVKITAIFPGFDPLVPEAAKRRAKELVRPLLRKAMAAKAHLQIDMEHYAVKALTLECVRELFSEPEFRDYPHLGVVLQAYLVDADRDVAQMIDYARTRGTPLWIRLVKGAYWDSETVTAEREGWPCPVWTRKWQSDACYERCARLLVENHAVIRSAFASHNIRSLAHAIALRDLIGAPQHGFELQMLFGMGDPIKRALADHGERCRVYTPYGDVLPGMAYLIRRLLENTANESFLRQGGDAGVPAAELLRDPGSTAHYRHCEAPRPADWSVVTIEQIQKGPFVNIPDSDFSTAAAQESLRSALRTLRGEFGREWPLVVQQGSDAGAGLIETRNPACPREIVSRVRSADAAVAGRAASIARDAAASWRAASGDERSEVILNAARRLQERRFEFAAALVLEIGKPWREADGEVSEAIDFLNYYAMQARDLRPPAIRDVPGENNRAFLGPRGVVAVIAPWNFPLSIAASMVAAPLVMGNAVLFKPASAAAGIGARFTQLLLEAGLPRGVLQFLPGAGESVGAALVRDPNVDVVSFSGSRAIGLSVNRLAAETPTARPAIRKVMTELGGKNAIIVDADADLDEALKGVIASSFGFAGQKCTGASRIIVLESIHARFVERFAEVVRGMSLSSPEEPNCSLPPLVNQAALETARQALDDAQGHGRMAAESQYPESLKASGGYYFPAVVLDDVPPSAAIAREEVLAPIVAILKAPTFDHAVTYFIGRDYARTGGLFSRSPAHIDRARNECSCGNFYINRKITGSKVDRQPFGGVKLSGSGARLGGPDYLHEFVEPRTISENTVRRGFAPSEEVAESLG